MNPFAKQRFSETRCISYEKYTLTILKIVTTTELYRKSYNVMQLVGAKPIESISTESLFAQFDATIPGIDSDIYMVSLGE